MATDSPDDQRASFAASHPTLQRGDKGEWVRRLQELLRAKQFAVTVDGDFGPATEIAVRSFQHLFGLEVDGVVGLETWTVLESE
jgi:peptidoglycan hydrolase-like protein with peptidoglycan-binding domain